MWYRNYIEKEHSDLVRSSHIVQQRRQDKSCPRSQFWQANKTNQLNSIEVQAAEYKQGSEQMSNSDVESLSFSDREDCSTDQIELPHQQITTLREGFFMMV